MEKIGKYRILREIGRGAMGVVYLAYDPDIQRKVAIKTMKPDLFEDEHQKKRFFREARAAGTFQHSNIVTVFQVGLEGTMPFIVMEYIEGDDLDYLIRKNTLTFEEKLKIMIQICNALYVAHKEGIIHRDIKPSNIRVMANNVVKVMDFGIAKRQNADLTKTNVIVGTLSYMSPEQVKGYPLTHKSDQFSVGVLFYQMLTGKHPFTAETANAIIYNILSSKQEHIDDPSIPSAMADAIDKMLSKSPYERFSDCREIASLMESDMVAGFDADSLSKYFNYLKDNVDFVCLVDRDTLKLDSELDIALGHYPKKEMGCLVWADTINEQILDFLHNLEHDRYSVIINDIHFQIRRVEMLIGSKVRHIFLHNGEKVFIHDMVQVCKAMINDSQVKNEQNGITRLLKIKDSSGPETSKTLEYVYDGKSIMELAKNLNIACLQLKGSRASGLFVDNMETDTLETIGKIITDDKSSHVLLNTINLSEEQKKEIEKISSYFRMVSLRSNQDLFAKIDDFSLPKLQEKVWGKQTVKLYTEIEKLFFQYPLCENFVSLVGEEGRISERTLLLPESIEISNVHKGGSEVTLMDLKKKILSKKYIFLNLKDDSIFLDLLRMIFQAGSGNYTIIAIGNKDNYNKLLEYYREIRERVSYKSRDIEIFVCGKHQIVPYLERLIKDFTITNKATKMMEASKSDRFMELMGDLKRQEELFQMAFYTEIGKVYSLYSKLSKSINLSKEKVNTMISENILNRFKQEDSFENIFRDNRTKKDFHSFLKLITPESSRTEFPINIEELLLIIKCIIYLSFGNKLRNISGLEDIEEKINSINLTMSPFEELMEQAKSVVEENKNLIRNSIKHDFEIVCDELRHNIDLLETILMELHLQFHFISLAVEQKQFEDFELDPEKWRSTEERRAISPVKELNQIFDILQQLEFEFEKV